MAEPDEAQKMLSREVYAKYINQTIVGKFGTDDFYQLWLYGDATFAQSTLAALSLAYRRRY